MKSLGKKQQNDILGVLGSSAQWECTGIPFPRARPSNSPGHPPKEYEGARVAPLKRLQVPRSQSGVLFKVVQG